MSDATIAAARASARALLAAMNVRSPADIQLERFAERFSAQIEEATLDGAEAQLVRTKDRTTIKLADRIKDVAKRRFNLAHEIAHLLLAHPTPRNANELACNPQRMRQATEVERAASASGSELLMPEALVRPLIDNATVDLEAPRRIMTDYTVSILTSAIRFTELSSRCCAAVFSVGGKVVWCARSASLQKDVAMRHRLQRGSVAAEYFANGDLDERPQWIPASTWFRTDADFEVLEHAVCSPLHGTTLSMIWVPDAHIGALPRNA